MLMEIPRHTRKPSVRSTAQLHCLQVRKWSLFIKLLSWGSSDVLRETVQSFGATAVKARSSLLESFDRGRDSKLWSEGLIDLRNRKLKVYECNQGLDYGRPCGSIGKRLDLGWSEFYSWIYEVICPSACTRSFATHVETKSPPFYWTSPENRSR